MIVSQPARKLPNYRVSVTLPTMTQRQAKVMVTMLIKQAHGAERHDDRELYMRFAEAFQNSVVVNEDRDNLQP